MLQLATDYHGGVCKAFYGSGSAIGTRDATGIAHGVTYRLRSVQSGHCLDVSNGSAAAGADVWQWTCNGGSAQDWRLENVGRGYYRLVARVSGHCLDVAGGSMAAGADVAQWYCNNLAPQIWRAEPV